MLVDLKQPGQDTFDLETFKGKQEAQRDQVQSKIVEISERCRKKFKEGIEIILADLRKKINESNDEEETQRKDFIKQAG